MPKFLKGDRVTAVECDDTTRQPRLGGRRLPGTASDVTRLFVGVTYDDPALHRGPAGQDVYYAESGWRAWDGEFRWRLEGPWGGWPS